MLDHDKPGLARATAARSAAFAPVFRGTAGSTVIAEMPPDAADALGAPTRSISRSPPGGGPRRHAHPARQAGQPDARGGLSLLPPRGRRGLAVPQDRALARAEQVARRGGGRLQAVFAAAATVGGRAIEIVPLDARPGRA